MTLKTTRLNGTLGARIDGIDFSVAIEQPLLETLAEALWTHQVLAIPAASMTPQQHLQIALHFGEPEHNATEYFQRIDGDPHITEIDSARGDRADSWHADETFLPHPPMINFLHAKILPDCGGDTAFISTRAAYAALSDRMKALLDGLLGEHDLAMTYEAGWRAGLPLRDKVAEVLAAGHACSHPVVMHHPANGEPWLNVSPTYTRFIEGLPPLEAQAILDFLLRHMQKPEFGFRYQWCAGDMLIWDQRAVQHYAVRDYTGRRLIQRISVLPGSRNEA
jgi:taurine dioxygenase